VIWLFKGHYQSIMVRLLSLCDSDSSLMKFPLWIDCLLPYAHTPAFSTGSPSANLLHLSFLVSDGQLPFSSFSPTVWSQYALQLLYVTLGRLIAASRLDGSSSGSTFWVSTLSLPLFFLILRVCRLPHKSHGPPIAKECPVLSAGHNR